MNAEYKVGNTVGDFEIVCIDEETGYYRVVLIYAVITMDGFWVKDIEKLK